MSSTDESKRLLVLLAGGYTKKEIQKHLLQTKDNEFLFEKIIDNIPAQNVVVITNQAYVAWWNEWKYKRSKDVTKPKRFITIATEKRNMDGSQPAPLFYVTTTIPSVYTRFRWNEVIVSPIDLYFEDFKFVNKLIKEKEAIVLAKYPDKYKSLTTVVKLKGLRGSYGGMTVKPSATIEQNLTDQAWVFTGMFKTTLSTLTQTHQQSTENLSDIITLLNKKEELKFVKYESLFRDYGNRTLYDEGISEGIIIPVKI